MSDAEVERLEEWNRSMTDALEAANIEVELLRKKLNAVRAAVEKHKHWTECGWDVPSIEIVVIIDADEQED